MELVTSWAWEQMPNTTKEKIVLLYLARCYDLDAGCSRASYTQIANATSLHKKSCERAVRLLVEQGLLRVERWTADATWKLVNRYMFPPLDGTEAGVFDVQATVEATVYSRVDDRTLIANVM